MLWNSKYPPARFELTTFGLGSHFGVSLKPLANAGHPLSQSDFVFPTTGRLVSIDSANP